MIYDRNDYVKTDYAFFFQCKIIRKWLSAPWPALPRGSVLPRSPLPLVGIGLRDKGLVRDSWIPSQRAQLAALGGSRRTDDVCRCKEGENEPNEDWTKPVFFGQRNVGGALTPRRGKFREPQTGGWNETRVRARAHLYRGGRTSIVKTLRPTNSRVGFNGPPWKIPKESSNLFLVREPSIFFGPQ